MTTIEDTCFQRTLADLLNVMFSFCGHVQMIIVAVIVDYNHGYFCMCCLVVVVSHLMVILRKCQ
jgi:hypothetical protein